jgi:hypothetical protein
MAPPKTTSRKKTTRRGKRIAFAGGAVVIQMPPEWYCRDKLQRTARRARSGSKIEALPPDPEAIAKADAFAGQLDTIWDHPRCRPATGRPARAIATARRAAAVARRLAVATAERPMGAHRDREAQIIPRNAWLPPGMPDPVAQSWGEDWPPAITASNWHAVRYRRFLGTVTLRVVPWRLSIAECNVMIWRRGMVRVFPPSRRWTSKYTGKPIYNDIFHFCTEADALQFEESTIAAVRQLLAEHGEALTPGPTAPELDDVPF